MSFSNAYENILLDYIFGGVSPFPANIDIALWIGNPGESGAGGAEVSGAGYARVETEPADWRIASGGAVTNENVITFPEATADWTPVNPVTHFALFDSSTMMLYGTLSSSKDIPIGSIPRFDADSLIVNLD